MCPSENFDVIVAGGGSAGVAAAVSAAELGSRTLLLERGKFLGGNVAHAFVHTICGLYCAADAGHAVVLNRGIPSRLAAGLRAAGVAGEVERAGRVYVLPIEPPRYAAFLAELCERTAGLEVRTETELVGVERTADRERHWELCARNRKSGPSGVATGWLVDTTGDANAAVLAGASVEAAGVRRYPTALVHFPASRCRSLGVCRIRETPPDSRGRRCRPSRRAPLGLRIRAGAPGLGTRRGLRHAQRAATDRDSVRAAGRRSARVVDAARPRGRRANC